MIIFTRTKIVELMISKNKIKLIKSLDEKKFRKENALFLAEGNKTVEECLPYFECKLLLATTEWLKRRHALPQWADIIEASPEEIKKASLLKSPQEVLALFKQPVYRQPSHEQLRNSLTLALDKVQDPGNLGTIIRIADWFGIENIFCSPDTADLYNPKVVQATMGAIARVKLFYLPLDDFFTRLPSDIPRFGTFLHGENIYESQFPTSGIIVMGNEGNGISDEVARHISHRLFIPNYPIGRATSESLNVAVATAITCSEFRRRSR